MFHTFNDLILNILEQIPTSEEAVERVFSRHKFVQSQIRASLRDDILENIIFLPYNLQREFSYLPFWSKEDNDRH